MSDAALRFDVFTLFPRTVEAPLEESIVRRAIDGGIVVVQAHDIRNWTSDRHRTADDTPYGGGAGMVMLAAPIIDGVEETVGSDLAQTRVLVMSPAGRVFDQEMANDLSRAQRVVIICGHYEGIDQRVVEVLRAEEVSIGDYVLTGGELAAAVIIDAVT
ncbi:MAG: tRNA (guanine(37)-N(1))-methyltransferase, partial [Chloroflexota bacterium]